MPAYAFGNARARPRGRIDTVDEGGGGETRMDAAAV